MQLNAWCLSVETVGFCTGNVGSKEDRPIFSVPVARATAHSEAEMVWSSLQQCGEGRGRDRGDGVEGGWLTERTGYGRNIPKGDERKGLVRGLKKRE